MAIFGKLFGKGKAEETASGPRMYQGQVVLDRAVLKKQNLAGGIIGMFQEDLRTCIEHVQQGTTASDAARTTQGSNGLRSIGTTIGSTALRNAAESMTKAAESKNWTSAVSQRDALATLVGLCVEELGDLAKELGV